MMVMLILGHTQDLLRRLRDIFSSPRANRTPPGYAPLMSDFDSFYTRRFYKRIEDVFNRPICSAPDSWLDVMLRGPALAKDGETPCHKVRGAACAAEGVTMGRLSGSGIPLLFCRRHSEP